MKLDWMCRVQSTGVFRCTLIGSNRKLERSDHRVDELVMQDTNLVESTVEMKTQPIVEAIAEATGK